VSRTGATDARISCWQEKGYLVLRYLAEDLAKELDSVLDGNSAIAEFAQSRGGLDA